MRTFVVYALTFLFGLAALAATRLAVADDGFDVSVAGGKVTVTAKAPWHINKEYPWKITVGDQKLDKSKFSLDEHSASVSAPKGAAKLKGAVCSGPTCKPFEKDITVQ